MFKKITSGMVCFFSLILLFKLFFLLTRYFSIDSSIVSKLFLLKPADAGFNNFKPEFIITPVKHSNSVQHVNFKGLSDMPRGFNIPGSLKCARYVDQQQKGLHPQIDHYFHC